MVDFKRIAILGMGLIGGSLALGLKKAGYGARLAAFDQNREALEAALFQGGVDEIYPTAQEAVKEADLVILAVPVGAYGPLLEAISQELSPHTLVTDVGSVKGHVAQLVKTHLPPAVSFIGGHPMAGSEKGGFEAASPTLFQNAYYFLTATAGSDARQLAGLEGLVKALGAYPVTVDTREHDRIVAAISHLPHLAAVLLVQMLELEQQESYASFAGGGFRDTTRIAAGNPRMWKDIFLFNREEMMLGIDRFQHCLQEMKKLLADSRETEIYQLLTRAKDQRDQLPHHRSAYLQPIYEIHIDVDDQPGALGEITTLLGRGQINIKEIEILKAREEAMGAIRIGFEGEADKNKAMSILQKGNFSLISRRGAKGYVAGTSN